MKIYKQNHKGQASLLIISQDENDASYLHQLTGSQLISVDESQDGQRRIRVMADLDSLKKPRPRDKFKDRSLDDLLDSAARRNLNVPRHILRDDLENILLTHETDPQEAQEMIALARPSMTSTKHKKVMSETGVGGAGRASFETSNDGTL